MQNYKIFVHSTLGSIEAVKEGWSWPAFFFNWIWAFIKGLNSLGFIVLGIAFGCGLLFGFAEIGEVEMEVLFFLISLGINIWMGTEGNEKICEMLIAKGFTYQETIVSSSPNVAILSSQQQGGGTQSTSPSSSASVDRDKSGSGYKKGDLYNKGE
jgi:Mn2+/Fe2+ NRAMP family transporter